ncbi:MAG: hypothetical protein D6729_13415 [Deltaproteobacteria bacterium]|nr:MAG: hypothetical protein D6729_13415 [Deltaproteobacteria bacterium]
MKRSAGTLLLASMALAVACGSNPDQDFVDEYGEVTPLDLAPPPEGKADGIGRIGPKIAWNDGPSRVWEVTRDWTDIDPEPGLAWPANSGLNWDQKFSAWVASLEKIDGYERGQTFRLTTPYGERTLPAPFLECAEVAIFLRAAFASWYGLPFYLEARDAKGPIYLGHMGFLRADGSRYGRSPAFSERYRDYTGQWKPGDPWPSDERLRSRGLYGGGDEVPFLGEGARAGAYFDEVFLNKRAGHFMLLVLAYFGSANLADAANMYHIQPEATRPGDVLLERWQRRGIGHTIPVMRRAELAGGRMELAIATGSMPRRQPVWEEGASAHYYFSLDTTGGPGENWDGEPYAALGGGIRRWRVALPYGGNYRNTFMPGDEAIWIDSTDLEAIAARPARFKEILAELTPEEERDLALERIESARAHLRRYPASCAARIKREDAFEDLYRVMAEHFGMTPGEVDRQYRILDDYVFAELVYEQSKTCCWNSTTPAMYEIIMDYNRGVVDDGSGTCNAPVPFMARNAGAGDDGYALFREHAQAIGRGDEWVDWSADETCPQADTVTDTLAETTAKPWCDLGLDPGSDPGPGPEPPPTLGGCGDTGADRSGAVPLEPGTYDGLRVCEDEHDWFTVFVSGEVEVSIAFSHAEGDLDLGVYDASGEPLASSASTSNEERVTVTADGQIFIEVYGYLGAAADYSLTIR